MYCTYCDLTWSEHCKDAPKCIDFNIKSHIFFWQQCPRRTPYFKKDQLHSKQIKSSELVYMCIMCTGFIKMFSLVQKSLQFEVTKNNWIDIILYVPHTHADVPENDCGQRVTAILSTGVIVHSIPSALFALHTAVCITNNHVRVRQHVIQTQRQTDTAIHTASSKQAAYSQGKPRSY